MQEIIKTTTWPVFEGSTALINRVDQFSIHSKIYDCGKQLASNYWAKPQIYDQMNPQKKCRTILNNPRRSNRFNDFANRPDDIELELVLSRVPLKSI